MQNRMLYTADILVDRHPVGSGLTRETLRMMRVGKPQEIPGTLEKRVECVLFPDCFTAAVWTADMLPCRVVGKRVARGFKIDVLGKLYWKIGFRHRHKAAGVTMDNRDRATPVPLA